MECDIFFIEISFYKYQFLILNQFPNLSYSS